MADALSRGRSRYNQRFALVRRAGIPLEADAVLDHLAVTVAPMITAVADAQPERVDAVLEALFDVSVDLFGAGALGPGGACPLLETAWSRLLALRPDLLAREPRRLAASLSNAIITLDRSPGARPQQWLDQLKRLAPLCGEVDQWLNGGRVAAWRAGMPQYRRGAIAVARGLPPALARAALGLPADRDSGDLPSILERMEQDPWYVPDAEEPEGIPVPAPERIPVPAPERIPVPAPEGIPVPAPEGIPVPAPERIPVPARKRIPVPAVGLEVVARVGAFRGFGGEFMRPPSVVAAGGVLFARDGPDAWQVIADRFGQVLVRRGAVAAADAARRDVTVKPDGTVRWASLESRFPALRSASSSACDGSTLAITLPTSHHVFLIARRAAPIGGNRHAR